MRKLIVATLICGAFICSCSKSKTEQNLLPNTQAPAGLPQSKDGGDDDDPVIIFKSIVTLKQGMYVPVSNVGVRFSHANNVIIAETEANGACNIYLPYLATWHMSLFRDNNLVVDADIDVVDTTMSHIDTLQ